ncbi:hypothetical protein CONPUDRAFT_111939 [Coniophora puteana RWD-64-598 SS2]|uniref:Integral membrane protein n=1 Tax=Coniophora puteana (strain RWD-64-598) TaxID=741705 RepID=A0A5M3MAB4_CONPW|nr:uncharacterized protein CONPUDRAFT_111939 [Coniophora puteana RWD-64-598 SS2]EIW76073.1 hypothetical protein CONPUDRAFT_111939 [Coniophora puteana RWD-64-598 SS2]
MPRISESPILSIVPSIFGTAAIGYGVNAILRPEHALTLFELEMPPASSPARKVVDCLMLAYGIRDIFMGVAVYAASYHGNRKALGAIMIALSCVAYADGLVCWANNGKGQWNHWPLAPLGTIVGGLLMGAMDK